MTLTRELHADFMTSAPMSKLDPREELFRIPWKDGLTLFLRHLGPAFPASPRKAVLYIHGATFPSALSIAHRFDGFSWRDQLNAAGYNVWGLDFIGYGGSDRYREMDADANGNSALGRSSVTSEQVETAVRFILNRQQLPRLSLIAHSWGSMPAARFASHHPALVDRIVLFAPISQRHATGRPQRLPAWHLITLQQQWNRFVEDVPASEPA